jgi:hypothetical protein
MADLKFQHLTQLDLSDRHMHVTYSTGGRLTKQWERIARKPECDPHRITEQTFESVRFDEFAKMPSRRHCIFMFALGLDPDFYADSLDFPNPEDYNVVEIEVTDTAPSLLRADKSLITRRIVDGKLTASIVDICSDARMYWSGYVKSDMNAEILLCGKYQFTRIIRPAEESFRPYLKNPEEILEISRSET